MRSYLARVRLVATDGTPANADLLARELPTVRVEVTNACGVCDAIVDADLWAAAADLSVFDDAVDTSPSDAISVRGPGEHLAEIACQVLGRYQRFVDRRNVFSKGPQFDVVLRAHGGWDERSVDRWQWLLRICPNASMAAQIAALFRDAPDHLDRAVHPAGLAEAIRVRARRMAREGDPDVEDAEGLSFLSLDSARSTRRDVTTIAASLQPHAREKLALIHLTPEVRHWLFESIAA